MSWKSRSRAFGGGFFYEFLFLGWCHYKHGIVSLSCQYAYTILPV